MHGFHCGTICFPSKSHRIQYNTYQIQCHWLSEGNGGLSCILHWHGNNLTFYPLSMFAYQSNNNAILFTCLLYPPPPPSSLKDQANHLSVLISPPLPLACSRHIFVRKPLRLCDHASGDKCLKELYSQSMMHYNNMCSAAYTFLELLHNPSFLEVMVKVATYTSWLVLIQKYWKYLDVGQKKNGLLSNLGYSPTVSQYLVSTVAFCATVVDLKKERFTPVSHCLPERDRKAEIESESGFGVRSSDLRQMRKR